MSTEVITAIISAVTTLIVSIGTWQVANRDSRRKSEEAMRNMLDEHKDEITQTVSSIQEHISIIDLKIETLSDRVDKHNNLVDRMYRVENRTDLQDKDIEHLKEKIS